MFFITSVNFWSDGKELLNKLDKGKFKSIVLNTGYDRTSLLSLLKEMVFQNEISIIEKFYVKED